MFKYQGFEYTLDEVTQAAQKENISVDEYVNKHGLETVEVTDEIQTNPTEGKTNGAAEVDAAVAPVATPSRASMIVDAQPESTELESVDTSGELQPGEQGYYRQEKRKKQKQDYADQLADPSQQPLIDSFSSAVSSVLYENGIYKLDVEGESVEDLIVAGVKDKVRDQALSNYYRLNPGQDLPMEDNLEQVLEDLIEKTRVKEVKEKRVAEDTALVKARQEGTYQSTIDAGFKHMVEDLTPAQRQFAKINQDVKRYQKISNDPNESETNRQAATNEIARLMPSYEASFEMMQTNDLGPELKENEQGYYRQQQKKKKAKYQYLFDPITNEKLTITEATSSGKGQDKSKEIKELTAQYANLDQELLERNLFQYLLNDKNNTAALNTTYDLKPTGQSAAEMATILGSKGYQADADGVIKNIPLKELRFMNDDFLQSSLKAAQPEGQATVIPDLPATIDYLYDQKLELGLQKEALNNTYFLNIDPASQKQTAVDVAGRFIETALEGAGVKPGVLPTSARKKLDEAEKLFLDAGITITPEQKENFERSFGMKVVEGVGAFMPELAKFAIANKIAGAAGITRLIAQLASKGRKIEAAALSIALEEAKFQGVTLGEAPTGAGAGFAIGGMTAAKFIPKFSGELARFNNLIEKPIGGAIGGVAGSNTAVLTEAMVSDLKGSASFKQYLNDYYGAMDSPIEDEIVNGIVFGILGGAKLRPRDLKSVSARRKMFDNLNSEIRSGKYKGAELEKKQRLAQDLNRTIQQADAKFNNLDIGSQKAEADKAFEVLATTEANTPRAIEAERTIANYEANKTAATRSIKRQEANINKSEIFKDKTGFNRVEIVEGRETFLDPNTKAEYDPISRSIKIDLESYRPGVLAEEVFHATFKAAFDQNPTAARVFKTSIQNDVNNALKGKKFTVNGKEDLTFEEAINESYGKTSRPEEYVANVTNFLRQPKYRDLLLEPGLLAGVKRTIVNIGNKAGLNFNSKTDFTTANQLINFLEGFGSVVEGGSARGIRKKFEQFQDIVIDGKKLIDIETGKEAVSETRQAKAILESINELVPKEVKTREDYFKLLDNPRVEQRILDPTTGRLNPAIENYIRSRSTSSEMAAKNIENVTDRLINFDPAKKRADGTTVGPEGFGEFIFANTRFGGLKAKEDLFIEGERQRQTESIDAKEAKQVADVTTTTEIKEDIVGKKPSETIRFSETALTNLGVENKQQAEAQISEAISKSFEGKDITRFGETRNVPQAVADIYGKMFGVNPETIVSKKRNFQKTDAEGLTRIKQFLIDNAPGDFARLPKTKDGLGKGTFLPKNVTDVLYIDGKLTGTLKDYMDLIREKPVKPIYRDRVGQTNRGLVITSIRNRIFEDLVPVQGQRLQGGARFAKDIKEFKESIEDKEVRDYFERITKNLEGDRFEQEIDYLKNQAETLGISQGEVVANLFTAEKNYQKLRKARGIKEGGASNISSVVNAEALRQTQKDFIKEMIPEGQSFNDLPKALQQSIVDTVGFGDTRITLGGRPLTYKEHGTEKNYSSLLTKVFGADVLIGKGSKISDATAVFAPRNWGDFRRKVEKIVEQEGITQEQAKKQVEDLLSAEGKTINETQAANFEILNKSYESLANTFIKNPTKQTLGLVADILQSQVNRATGIFKGLVPVTSFNMKPEKGTTKNQNKKMHNEHLVELFNANKNFINLLDGFMKGRITKSQLNNRIKFNTESLEQAVISERMRVEKDASGAAVRDFANPLTFLGKDAGNQVIVGERLLPSGERFTGLNMAEFVTKNLSQSQVQQIARTKMSELNAEGVMVKQRVDNKKSYDKTIATNNSELPPSLSFTEKQSNEKVIKELGTLDKALKVARDPKAPVKKIRVFDFDDTLARSNSKVVYEMPDGKTGKLNATQFAERAGELEAQGATFDFAEFSKVVDGKKGPVFKAIENIVAKRGVEDVFILTARPADAAGPIKQFMDALGVKLPIENIVGLGDGKAQAKARWITGKAAEGYNDFFFVDDAYKNVKAVKRALDVFDVKSKVQQAKVRYAKDIDLSKDFNDIIENKTGIGADKVYSRAKAQVVGASKGSIFKGIPYSAQDFTGLLYETLGKGKVGDQQMAWYKKNLIDPFARGVNDISRDRVAMMNDYKVLKKQLGVIPKDLRKKLPGEPYTKEQAVRVYTWNTLQSMEVPGVSKADLKTLNDYVTSKPELQAFAEQLVAINKGDGYAKPKETWLTGSITTDLLEGLNTTKRAKYLEQWQTNADQIFSEANLNKLEAAYGKKYRKAIENSLQRMKTGRNRSFSDDGLTGRFTDWLNGSIGVTMFFNTRSALLQTLSSVNFVNFSDNNPLKAAKAFGNQKQYWKDFKYLMNSDFLKERRGGLRMNVNEADIAEAASKNGPRGVVNKLLQFGFTPTQIADSFAIASGGSTFYRNRIKTYEKQGLSTAEAEAKAFEDFRETAEESQQSSRPDRISMQQAGPLGRPILAYGNTPAQYLRKTDKAIKDLKAGRGDAKTNISKIIYYTTVQNLIFNSLQQGLFAIAFGEADADDEKYEKKYIDVANGMADSILRGAGVGGSAVSVGKNAIIRIMREQEKKQPKLEKVGYELAKISPPVSSKLSKINQAARSYQWDKDEMISKGFSIDNPAYLAGANVIAATTNVPLDRAIKKVNNVIAATEADAELWERLALMGGWPEWSIEEPESKKPSSTQPRKIKRRKIKKKIIK